MWMSSSARENSKRPASISPLTWSSPLAMASASAGSTMLCSREHRDMGFRAGNILLGELAVEVDRGVDLLHDLGRTTAKRPPHILLLMSTKILGTRNERKTVDFRNGLVTLAAFALAAVAAGVFYGRTPRPGQVRGGLLRRFLAGAGGATGAARQGEIAALRSQSRAARRDLAFNVARRREADARRFLGPGDRAQSLGDMVRALPRGNAGARSAAGEGRRQGIRGGRGQRRHRATRRAGAFLDGTGVKELTRYADPSGDAWRSAARRDALGLPTRILIDSEGC